MYFIVLRKGIFSCANPHKRIRKTFDEYNTTTILIASDIDLERMGKARTQFSATIVPPDHCPAAEADVYAPCALEGSLSERAIGHLLVSIVAGGANNQLAAAEDRRRLADRGVLYAPD
jgi:leucine dehydrogenase